MRLGEILTMNDVRNPNSTEKISKYHKQAKCKWYTLHRKAHLGSFHFKNFPT